eukprot:3632431-Amphidinium_carterae.1
MAAYVHAIVASRVYFVARARRCCHQDHVNHETPVHSMVCPLRDVFCLERQLGGTLCPRAMYVLEDQAGPSLQHSQ